MEKLLKKPTRGKMRNVDRAYLAGFIDGEGSIGLYSTNYPKQRRKGWSPSFFIRLAVCNTDKEIPEFLKDHYGGSCLLEHPGQYSYSNRIAKIYRYNATGKICYEIIKDIVPYLKQKKERALLAIKFYQNRKKLTWNEKENLRMKFIATNGISGKSHHPQRLNERTPYGKKSNQDKPFINDLIRRSDSPILRETVSQT